jgi:hypothetical protein
MALPWIGDRRRGETGPEFDGQGCTRQTSTTPNVLMGLGCRVEGARVRVELEFGGPPGEDRRHANCSSPPCGTTRT